MKALPASHEAEAAIIGACLIDPAATDESIAKLSGSEFDHPKLRKMFGCIAELVREEEKVDLITLVSKLQEKGWLEEVGGVSYLGKLADAVPTTANIEYYIRIVIEKHAHRRLIEQLQEKLELAWEAENPFEVISSAQSSLEDISEVATPQKEGSMIRDVLPGVFESVEEKFNNKANGGVTGLTTGFVDLDRMTSGLQKSDLIIVAARPSVGKTAFALNIASNAAKSGTDTGAIAVFSLEMSDKQLTTRMVCAEGNVDAQRVRTGWMEPDDWQRLAMAVSKLSELPIIIDDTPSISVNEIRSRCRKIKKQHGLSMILIDYLQLMSGRGGKEENRQAEISYISRNLKQIARELDVPIIALSQLSRNVEQRQDKRPMMSDLRESGSIEQDADIVAFLYRDDYYDKESEKKNIIEVIIAKQRNGPVGTVELAFLKNYNKFASLDRTGSG